MSSNVFSPTREAPSQDALCTYEPLSSLYPNALRRLDTVYPVVIVPHRAPLRGFVKTAYMPECDARLLTQGQPHLQGLRSEKPFVHDGDILCWVANDWVADEAGQVVVTEGSYYDMLSTCDSLRSEYDALRTGSASSLPMRDRVHQLAGDPLESGRGRAAGVGVTVVLTIVNDHGSACEVLLGRRGRSVATDFGLWHLAPSGMLESAGDDDPIVSTILREVHEELGLSLSAGEVERAGTVLGLAHDLLRLRPDIVVRVNITSEVLARKVRDDEFSELLTVPISSIVTSRFWVDYRPTALTPSAAGAVALLAASVA